MNITGCAGVSRYTDKAQAIDIAMCDNQETTTTVRAEVEEWRNSGVILKNGLKYKITVTGTWSVGPICGWTGPDGNDISLSCNLVPSSNLSGGGSGSMLVGKIGEAGIPFQIGNRLELKAQEEGILFLRINEKPGIAGDNSGSVDVTIALKETNKKIVARPASTENKDNQRRLPVAGQRSSSSAQKWAVVIGISKYKDSRIAGLRYASADVHSFYEWLISQQGGGYAPSRIRLLLDSEATVQNIKNALFNWLKQPLKEDMVTIYFAGHGSPESPDSPNNLFLLPYDSVYDDVATTGFPM